MRYSILVFVAAVVLAPEFAQGQRPDQAQLDVQVGFAGGAEPGEPVDERGRAFLFKPGAWTLVYVQVEAGMGGTANPGTVIVETADADDVQNRYSAVAALPKLNPAEVYTVLTYTKPGSQSSDIKVTVQVDGRTIQTTKPYYALDLGDKLWLTVGSRLVGLRQALQSGDPTHSSPRYRAAYVDSDVERLPHRWFGYDAADLVILTGGNRNFLERLLGDKSNRKEALAEWVRRGGRLIVCAGRNEDVMAKILAYCFPEPMSLPVEMKGTVQLPRLDGIAGWANPNKQLPSLSQLPANRLGGAASAIEIAKLEPKPGWPVEWMVPKSAGDRLPALMVRAPYGLGQVTLIAFDLDLLPFIRWPGQADFWTRLLKLPQVAKEQPNPVAGFGSGPFNNEPSDLATVLQNNLEQFEDIPVISFGWVALFIFVYILIVGPLDYFFLKKVVKRLELTWITFPAVVLAVSVIAYLAAYSLKGHELKINKVDVVDIDLRSGQAYGQSWFTLFSPRIQHYTIGIEPAAPLWVAEPEPQKRAAAVVVSWMGRPDSDFGGYGRTRSQGLFRRAYDYAPDAAGLSGVPIQVWATKSFTACWERPLNGKQLPLSAELQKTDNAITGALTNRLPFPLQEAVLIYGGGPGKGTVFSLGNLEPNVSQQLHLQEGQGNPTLSSWVAIGAGSFNPSFGRSPGAPNLATHLLMRQVLFYAEVSRQSSMHNEALYRLDQTWRVRLAQEAILFARIGPLRLEGQGNADHPDPRLPTWLWLSQLPGSAATMPSLPGTLVQNTYVRFFIPVQVKAQEND